MAVPAPTVSALSVATIIRGVRIGKPLGEARSGYRKPGRVTNLASLLLLAVDLAGLGPVLRLALGYAEVCRKGSLP
jgi:hypothetical protein